MKKVAEINKMEDLVATDRGLREQYLKKCYYWLEFYYLEEYARQTV